MPLFDKKFASGFALGLGAGLLGPKVLPVAADAARPLLKASVKAGLLAIERGREAAAHVKEAIEDGVAEARSELAAMTEPAPEQPAQAGADSPPLTTAAATVKMAGTAPEPSAGAPRRDAAHGSV